MASYSTNLLLALLAQGDSGALGFANWGDAAVSNFNYLEDAITEKSALSVTSANVTLSDEENRSLFLSASGVLTGNRSIIVADRKGLWAVYNGCSGAYTLTVKTSAGSGVVVAQSHYAIVYCDGTNVLPIVNGPVGINVTEAGTQTLTNKTISGGSISSTTTGTTQSGSDNSTKLATTAYVDTAVSTGGGTQQPLDAGLTSIAGLTTSANQMIYLTASDTYAVTTITSAGRALIDDADASAMRTTLGLVIGTNVQAYDAELAAIAGLTSAADRLPYFTGSGTASLATFTSAARSLLDDSSTESMRTTLGLGSAAVLAASGVIASVVRNVYTTSGTWTKDAKTLYVEVELVGGGGGSGAVDGQSGSDAAGSAGGGGGGYVKKLYAAADLSATEAYVVGAGGSAGTGSGGTNGSAGADSTFKALTASGGALGTGRVAAPSNAYLGGNGGAASGGDINIPGSSGTQARWVSGLMYTTSRGGDSHLGKGGREVNISTGSSAAANAGTGYGGGAGGAMVQGIGANENGAAGADGVVIITEYRSA